MADALHEAAVTGDHEGVMVHRLGSEVSAQATLGDRHADRVGESLPERAGGHLDTGGVVHLGVARRGRAPLAELLDVVELEAVAGQEKHRVLQDRGVTVREDEPVAVDPVRIGGGVPHDPAVQHVGERSERHRRALVAALRVERGIHGEPTDQRDGLLFLFRGQRHVSRL